MRQRITCLVLLVALAIPAAGWARVASIDPDGEQILSAGGGLAGWDESALAERSSTAASTGISTTTPATSPAPTGWLRLAHRFLGWLGLWYGLA